MRVCPPTDTLFDRKERRGRKAKMFKLCILCALCVWDGVARSLLTVETCLEQMFSILCRYVFPNVSRCFFFSQQKFYSPQLWVV